MVDKKIEADREESGPARASFLHDIIDADLASGKHTQVVTRFPPEPNGYLHIGHAKSIVLNFGLAKTYGGRCHLRFDDTNPLTEEVEYVESIQNDVRWLGYDWGKHLYFASDYFEKMYQCAVLLIKKGLAYVDSLPQDTIREMRGTLTEPGTPSPYRDRSVEENLDLFARMRAGEFENGAHVLRAKIDLGAANMLMRDPLLYRIRHAHHHRTGDAWCIYPMYDFAHCLEDAFEHVTHSICTLEFENNRELYDWLIRETEVEAAPRQYEFARLNLTYTVMSKRKLLKLVQDKDVSGWDDPRMPTIAGLRRRGVPPEAIRKFCHLIGVAKANSTVDIELFDFAIRDELNQSAPRVMCVLDPLKVVITNYPEGQVEEREMPYFPPDFPEQKTRKVPFTREIYIEREDFMENPPKGWHRLAPGKEVRLRFGYFIKCEEVVRDAAGEIVELRCTYDPETLGGSAPDGRKVKGTLHWVSADHSLPAEVRVYDRLFAVEKPDAGDADFKEYLNPNSLVVLENCRVETSVAGDDAATRYQFERQGYFWRDPVDGAGERLVFNRIVNLRDSWAKESSEPKKPEAASKPAPTQDTAAAKDRPNKRPASYERDKAREANPALAEKFAAYQNNLGLSSDDADLLSGNEATAEFFEAALGTHGNASSVAASIVNDLLPLVGEDGSVADLEFTGEQFGGLVKLVDDDKITAAVSRDVLAIMVDTGRDAADIVTEKGLEKVSDTAAIEPLIDAILARNPDNVERYRAGKTTLIGFFIGQVMRETGGKVDGTVVRELLETKLAG
jgi:glutaminyl-tRNA synthetase